MVTKCNWVPSTYRIELIDFKPGGTHYAHGLMSVWHTGHQISSNNSCIKELMNSGWAWGYF